MFPHVIRAAGAAVLLLAGFFTATAQGSAQTAETPAAAAPPPGPSPAPAPAPAPAPTPAAAPPPAPVQNLPKEEASGVLGHDVRAADGRDMGRIVDVVVDHNGQPRAAVIDFGGFLGVGSRKIAVDWAMLHFTPGKADVPITLDLTPDQLKATPEYSATATTGSAVAVAPDPAAPPAPAAKP